MPKIHAEHGFAPAAALLALSLLVTAACGPSEEEAETVPPPPETRVEAVTEELHGVEIADPYRWLEDQESPETRGWIEAQNAYTDQLLEPVLGREKIAARYEELLKTTTVGIPTKAGERYFFMRRDPDDDLAVLYLRQGADGEDEVLIDPHPMSEDHTTSISPAAISDDGQLLAYSVREGGEDETTIRFFDVENRQDLPLVLPRAVYFGFSLTPDRQGLYFTRREEEGPRVYYRPLAEDGAEERIFGDGYGPEKILFGGLSEDGRYMIFVVYHGAAGDHTEVWLQDVAAGGPIRPVVTDIEARFLPSMAGDRLLLETEWQAPNGRVMAVDPANPDRSAWQELIPERQDAVIQGVSTVGGKLFVNYLENVQSSVEIFEADGTEAGEIAFDSVGTVGSMGGRWDQEEAFYAFSSFHRPSTIYRYDVPSGDQEVWFQQELPLDSDSLTVEQLWFESKDGTRVPMFVVHGKGLEKDGDNPTMLTGYGGFTASLTPGFTARAVVWAEQGGVYAVANLRGGGEFGEAWHEAGMRENKQNVFDDFIAAAEHLIASGYTKPEKLAIAGGSNGGLLVGAVANQRPELFAAVVCSYPLLDMIRYHQFLMGPYWVPEYGSADDPELFEVLYAYSPYHNVAQGVDYPAYLFITGDGDTRVAPLHARKMAALMQATVGTDEPVLLRYHTKAGHSGGQPISEQIANATEMMAFLRWQLGMGDGE